MGAIEAVTSVSWVGDRHLRISLAGDPSSGTRSRVLRALDRLRRGGAGIPGLRGVTPAYATVLLAFDPATLEAESARAAVLAALGDLGIDEVASPPRLIEVPVCYEGGCAPDMDDVARIHGLSAVEVASLHSGAEYVVQFIGFSPGFGYLGGLPAKLATPRLDRPRVRVPAGSVGIAGDQTGVYPHPTPGGWRLIGRTPLKMFDAGRDDPSLLAAGDRVRFMPIDLGRFQSLAGERV